MKSLSRFGKAVRPQTKIKGINYFSTRMNRSILNLVQIVRQKDVVVPKMKRRIDSNGNLLRFSIRVSLFRVKMLVLRNIIDFA